MFEAATSQSLAGSNVMDRTECLDRLRNVPLGRVVVVKDGSSRVLPVLHVMDGDYIVFQLARTLRSDLLESDLLTFQANGTREGADWSVTVQGRFDIIDGLPTMQPPPGFEPSASSWSRDDIPTIWVRIRPDMVTGGVTGIITLD